MQRYGGDHGRKVTQRGQLRVEDSTDSNRCLRRDEGIVDKVVRLVPYTSPQTCSVPGGICRLPLVVLPEENLDTTPRALDGIGVGPVVRIHELDSVVDGSVRVTLKTEIAVCTPAITDDCSARFDPVTYDGHQCVGGSVLHGNKKCFAKLSFNTAKHPMTLNRVSPMILSPTELALINFDSLVRTTSSHQF